MRKCPQQFRRTPNKVRDGAGHTKNYCMLTVPGQLPNCWGNLIQKIAKNTLQLWQNSFIIGKE